MFRTRFSTPKAHECEECLSTVVCVVGPSYKRVEDLIDDFISLRVGIIKITKKKLTDSEVYEWLLDEADSEFGAQFTNGESNFFLLKRKNVVEIVQRIIQQHNEISIRKSGKKALYSSSDVIEAIRDARIFFNQEVNESDLILEASRAYVQSHLTEALACELAEHQILEKRKRDSFDGIQF